MISIANRMMCIKTVLLHARTEVVKVPSGPTPQRRARDEEEGTGTVEPRWQSRRMTMSTETSSSSDIDKEMQSSLAMEGTHTEDASYIS